MILGLLVLVFVTFSPLLSADFTCWDDPHTVSQNLMLNPVRGDTWKHYWTQPAARIYIPLTYTVWSALTFVARVSADDHGITLNPTWFHIVNLSFHAGGAMGVFCLLSRVRMSLLAAGLGACVFAIHPVQTEAVGWISGLKDVMAGFFGVWAVYGLIRLRHSSSTRAGARWMIFILLAQLAAVLSKPSAITLPLVVGVIDLLLLRSPWRRTLILAGAMLLVVAPFAIVARIVQIPRIVDALPIWYRPLIAMDSVAFYLCKVVWPATLTVDYGRKPAWVLESGWAYLTPLITLLLGIGAYVAWKRDRAMLACAALVFVLAPLHVLGLVRFDFQTYSTTADHYLYFAMLGPAMAGAWAVSRYSKVRWIAVVLLVALAARSFSQSMIWSDEKTLMTHVARKNPDSVVALNNLSVIRADEGHREEAMVAWRRAIEIDPTAMQAWTNLGRELLLTGRVVEARDIFEGQLKAADDEFSGVVDARTEAYASILVACLHAGRPDEAAYWLEQARRSVPMNAQLERIATQIRGLNASRGTRQVTGVSG